MESILDLVTMNPSSIENDTIESSIPSLTTQTFPYRICEISLPQCQSGFVYFLISVRTLTFTYIGECKCIVKRLRNHNSGYGSNSTTPANKRPYAIFGYIAGFNDSNKSLRRFIERKWKEKRDYLISQGVEDPRRWFQIGATVIQDLDNTSYHTQKSELRLIELFRM